MRLVADRREKSQLAGDFLRECSSLIAVLYALEAALLGKFDWWIFLIVLIGAGACLWWGMILEGRDDL
jgi:hypothetical protein